MPYFWSDQYDVKIQCLGEPEADDVVHVVEDDGRKFLAYYERDGAVVGVVGGGMPGKVMKARARSPRGAPIADVLGVRGVEAARPALTVSNASPSEPGSDTDSSASQCS